MSKGSGLSRSERRRNARKERLRALVPRDGAVIGIDLGEEKQAWRWSITMCGCCGGRRRG